MVSLGPRRRVVPNQNFGRAPAAQRRVAEAAGRAAEKARVSVAVDAWPALLYLRDPRGTVPCPCCAALGDQSSTSPSGRTRVVLHGGQLDDVGAVDSGYPLHRSAPESGTELAAENARDDPSGIGSSVQRLLLGNGRRCGICWGTGWIDGHRLWGGARRVMCVLDAPGVTYVDGDLDVAYDDPTPTMVGPGAVTWRVRVNHADRHLDALRVRDGLLPSAGGYVLTVSADEGITFRDPRDVMPDGTNGIHTGEYLFRLTLRPLARVSHVELISRSEPLVNVQLPQLQQAAGAELIAPMLVEDFELDPVVGFVERGSVLDVRPRDGRVGSVWLITDVMVKRTSAGQVFGVTGTAMAVQPTDVLAAASSTDALRSGLLDRGLAPRGLEASGGGAAMGDDPVGTTDASVQTARRGSQQRLGGGSDAPRTTIVLNSGRY